MYVGHHICSLIVQTLVLIKFLFFIYSTPNYFGNLILGEGVEVKIKKREREADKKLWNVKDVLDSRGEGEQEEVLVVWEGYDESSWVLLRDNPELESYLYHTQGNPFCSTLTTEKLPPYKPELAEIMALRGAIFDKLNSRATVAGDIGISSPTVEIPFSLGSLQRFLGKGNFEGRAFDLSGRYRVSLRCLRHELDLCFEESGSKELLWYERNFTTTTSCVVDPGSPIHINWSYQVRKQYVHTSCLRCHHTEGSETSRPSMCNPESICLPGPPILRMTFKKMRVNRIAVS